MTELRLVVVSMTDFCCGQQSLMHTLKPTQMHAMLLMPCIEDMKDACY